MAGLVITVSFMWHKLIKVGALTKKRAQHLVAFQNTAPEVTVLLKITAALIN